MLTMDVNQLVPGRAAVFNGISSDLEKLLEGMSFGALTTIGSDGIFQRRPVSLVSFAENGDLWLITCRKEERTCPMNGSRSVHISFEDPFDQRFVTITARPEVVQDRRKLRTLWDDRAERDFPAGLEDPFVTLLYAHVESIDAWNARQNRVIHTDIPSRPSVAADPRIRIVN